MTAQMLPRLPWGAVVIVVALCLAGTAFCAGAETGMMSVSRIRLRALARARVDARARRLAALLRDVEDPILTFLIGTNLLTVVFTAVLTAAFSARWGHGGEWAAGIVAAVLAISVGEVLPKGLFREYPERLMLASMPLIRALMALFAPARWVLRWYSRLWRRLLPGGGAAGGTALSREAMTALLLAHPQSDLAARRFAEVLERIGALGRAGLRELMLPIAQAATLPTGATLAEARSLAALTGFSRLPVRDAEGGIAGWILVRDLLLAETAPEAGGIPPTLLRSCLLVDAEMTPYELFEEMHWQRQQMAIMVDARGEALGLLTLENLVEAIVGGIEDEFDLPASTPRAAAGRAG